MESKEIVISPVRVEDPILHTIAINDLTFNVAIQLKTIVLIGASINSVNSEYRQFNLNVEEVERVFSSSSADKRLWQFFHRVKKTIVAHMKKDSITFENDTLKNVSFHGIDYAIIYYIILKRFGFSEEHYVNMNSFTSIVPVLAMFDKILAAKHIRLVVSDMKALSYSLTSFDGMTSQIGSKILCISQAQIEDTSNLTQSLWKSMYINRILRTIPNSQRQNFFSPSLDWGLIRCPTKYLYTNDALVAKVAYSENIHYIRTTATKQQKLASALISDRSLDDVKHYAMKLKESTISLDYILSDLSLVVFYANSGDTLFNSINIFIEETKLSNKLAINHVTAPFILNHETFKQTIFQYMYATFLLTKHGIIHNDPHLNNILISRNSSKVKYDYQLPGGKIISIGYCGINLTLIDYDKSILSYRHGSNLEEVARIINEEMGIVFDDIKRSIVDEYDQIFKCYAMYDVVKFALILMRMLDDLEESLESQINRTTMKLHRKFLQK